MFDQEPTYDHNTDGVLRCGRYAFGPNRLHYCGPDANRELFAYIEHGISDPGLTAMLGAFQTLYPYLRFIAAANGIRDPFDARVVEAYWIGNQLLENVAKRVFYRYLLDTLNIKKKIGGKSFDAVHDILRRGGVPHHSFHVFSVWRRAGHFDIAYTVQSIDSCRISWGVVGRVDGPFVDIHTEPVVHVEGKLVLGDPVEKRIMRSLESPIDIDELHEGDLVSLHWDVICEVLTPREVSALKRYTLRHLALVNRTL